MLQTVRSKKLSTFSEGNLQNPVAIISISPSNKKQQTKMASRPLSVSINDVFDLIIHSTIQKLRAVVKDKITIVFMPA